MSPDLPQPNNYSCESEKMDTQCIEVPLDELRSLVAKTKSVTRGPIKQHVYNGTLFSFRTGRIRRILDRPKCVCCGKEVNHARIASTTTANTVDVGHLAEDGSFVRFTVDHLLLDCMGGRYNDDNLQTMCAACNTSKGDLMTELEINAVRKNPRKYAAEWVDIPYLMFLLDMQEYELRLRSDGVTTKKELNMFHMKLSKARCCLTADRRKIPSHIDNPYAAILRPPIVTGSTFVDWIKSMPSVKELVRNWLYSHNIFMYC